MSSLFRLVSSHYQGVKRFERPLSPRVVHVFLYRVYWTVFFLRFLSSSLEIFQYTRKWKTQTKRDERGQPDIRLTEIGRAKERGKKGRVK